MDRLPLIPRLRVANGIFPIPKVENWSSPLLILHVKRSNSMCLKYASFLSQPKANLKLTRHDYQLCAGDDIWHGRLSLQSNTYIQLNEFGIRTAYTVKGKIKNSKLLCALLFLLLQRRELQSTTNLGLLDLPYLVDRITLIHYQHQNSSA